MFKKIVRFFDKFEDVVRGKLSHYPILYALVGAVGIVLVWKGVWETAEFYPVLWGPTSIILGILILLATGLMVSFFIGDTIILSGIKRDKKIAEKSEKEIIEAGKSTAEQILAKIDHMEEDMHELKGTPKESKNLTKELF
ncbi:hypothetical protein HYS79_03155 [Patescibacteria group bacterium]|nr:hypothetical protein [Patescibacteria group bacterium]